MSTTQPEYILEQNLVKQLQGMGYQAVELAGEPDMLQNLQEQLEKHNGIRLSAKEFIRVLTHLNRGNVFDRAHILRDKMALLRDDDTTAYIEFLNTDHWCQNLFQVCTQVTMEGKYENR